MYLPQNDISEVVLRQRNRRDDLSKELSKNKSKLNAVQQEYHFLTQPLNTDYLDECERLDDEIDKLRRVCQVMLNEIEHLKRSQEPLFERQPVRPAPPPPPYPPPRMRPQTLFPRQSSASSPLSPRSPDTSSSSNSEQLPTSPSSQDLASPAPSPKTIDDVCDPNCGGEQPWQCSMCTFQNHPLLNKCECCDNVRILPGSVRILPSRPPPPIPFALGSRSAPLTPATPITPNNGPQSACVLSRSTEYTRQGVTNSSSEGSMPQFLGDVII
ncbi:uncharacterized protein LOC129919488 [Episyrphus balteatus]|uniref:uncharacterized protein LOC129919488 n=1 Tax=Episyrphus balteatus TaxID=286459 RepID=UPI00248573CD|nr:uncharacterized protein LOC129919488 [Episyrphus balteatus]